MLVAAIRPFCKMSQVPQQASTRYSGWLRDARRKSSATDHYTAVVNLDYVDNSPLYLDPVKCLDSLVAVLGRAHLEQATTREKRGI